jgi:hypothetical protein
MDGRRMVGFGGKQAWLAVRDADPAAVVAALGLRNLGTSGWRDAVDLSHFTDDRLLVTPPLPGAGGADWVLVAGRYLLPGSAVDLVAVSATLATQVQEFATYRVRERHRWARAEDGELVRAFGWDGEAGRVTRWVGGPDATERALGLPSEPGAEPDFLVGEADVLRVAGAWSLDPTTLDGRPAPGPARVAAPR